MLGHFREIEAALDALFFSRQHTRGIDEGKRFKDWRARDGDALQLRQEPVAKRGEAGVR